MVNALAELVTAHCERTGDSLAAIAKRGGMSRQTLSGLVNRAEPNVWLRQSTLEALARGLGITPEAVRQVVMGQTYGNGEGAPPRQLLTSLIAHAETLTDPELEVLLATAQALKAH